MPAKPGTRRAGLAACALAAGGVLLARVSPAPPGTPPILGPVARGMVDAFPYVRVDRAAGVVEFDGIVPIDAHDPKTPLVFLEEFVCTPDSREYESLVVTKAKPSHVHAALLLAGGLAGKPGEWRWAGPPEGRRKPATPTAGKTC